MRVIAFLRAINVGGRVVPMAKLRALFAAEGATDVVTYIQSGNVFFTGPTTQTLAAWQRRLEARLLAELGYEVPVMLRTVDQLVALVARDPFRRVVLTADTRFLVFFLSASLPKGEAFPTLSAKGDAELIGCTSSEAFVVATVLNGRPGNPGAWLEKTYGVQATGRYWHTLQKILAAAQAA
jgi:uncharacterized protein (DUF1697 family)